MTNAEITQAAKKLFNDHTFNEVKAILNYMYKHGTPAELQIAKAAMAMKHRAASRG